MTLKKMPQGYFLTKFFTSLQPLNLKSGVKQVNSKIRLPNDAETGMVKECSVNIWLQVS